MKKTLLLALGIFAAFTASAATITSNCNLFPVTFMNGAGGPTAVSCPGYTPSAGSILTGVSLTYAADYQFGGAAGTNTLAVTFVPTGPTTSYTPLSVTLNPSGGVSSGAVPTMTSTYTGAVSNALFASAFNVNISSAVVQGSAATSSGAATVTYTFTTATIPEPATYGLMGSALALLFAMRRRKQS